MGSWRISTTLLHLPHKLERYTCRLEIVVYAEIYQVDYVMYNRISRTNRPSLVSDSPQRVGDCVPPQYVCNRSRGIPTNPNNLLFYCAQICLWMTWFPEHPSILPSRWRSFFSRLLNLLANGFPTPIARSREGTPPPSGIDDLPITLGEHLPRGTLDPSS